MAEWKALRECVAASELKQAEYSKHQSDLEAAGTAAMQFVSDIAAGVFGYSAG